MDHEYENDTVLQGDVLDSSLDGAPFLLPSGYPYAQSLDCVLQAKADVAEMSAPFTIVTRSKQLNRHGNKVQIAPGPLGEGILLANYEKNPVVLFDHGMSLPMPIGKSEDQSGKFTVKLGASQASAVVFFSQKTAEAAQVFGLIEEGILRTASIAFIPRKAMRLKLKPAAGAVSRYDAEAGDVIDLTQPYMALDFLESEMFEWSVVGVPADPDAVRKCLDRGLIGQSKITRSLLPTMQRMAGQKPAWAPGFAIPSQTLTITSEGRTVTMGGIVARSTEEWNDIISAASETFLRLAEKPRVDEPEVPAIIPEEISDGPAVVSMDAAEPTEGLGMEAITEAIRQGFGELTKPFVQKQEALDAGLRRLFGQV